MHTELLQTGRDSDSYGTLKLNYRHYKNIISMTIMLVKRQSYWFTTPLLMIFKC